MTDDEARAILADQARRVATLWRALDLDGDDILSAAEIDAAPQTLAALDLDGDGIITADDIAAAPDRLRRLDRLGRGHLVPTDDLPAGNPIIQQTYDGPAQVVEHFDILRAYDEEPSGPILPGTDPHQDPGYLLIDEHSNAGDVQIGGDLFLMAADGTRVHHWPHHLHPSGTVSPHLRDDGLLLRSGCPGIWLDVLCFPVGAHGVISLVEPDGAVVWECQLFEPGRRVLHNDYDPSRPNHGEIGPGCRRIDLNYSQYPRYRFNMGQIMHVNTITYDPTRDQILLSSATHGELWVIDHSTTSEEARGSAGDLLYRWGNPSSHRAGPESTKILDWQHDIRGRWTWDLDDPLNGAEITWSYNAAGDKDWFSPFMSGARRRPNGNTVTALGYNKRIREVTPDGETVLDFKPGGPGRTFRAVPIAADHPGLTRLGLADHPTRRSAATDQPTVTPTPTGTGV